jgi:HAD superfamily hydrolase (TIGR01509 family)
VARLVLAHDPDDLVWRDYAALLFDWDGTLVDSHAVNYASLKAALASQGAALAELWFSERTGTSSAEMAALVASAQGVRLDIERVVADRDGHYLTMLERVEPIDPVVRVLRAARGTALTALATGGAAGTVLPTVERLGLTDLFDAVVTRADAERGKPAPDIFLEAARRLDVQPFECLVFEDSDEGIAAAAAAGMDAIDVRGLRPQFAVDTVPPSE